jgi:hypothetical protein
MRARAAREADDGRTVVKMSQAPPGSDGKRTAP